MTPAAATALPWPSMRPGPGGALWARVVAALLGPAGNDDPCPEPAAHRDALRRRDPSAWRDFAAAELNAVYQYVLSRIGNPADAEDLASQVFEEAWKHSASLHDSTVPARAWLFGIARNVVNTHRRNWFRKPPPVTLDGFDQSDDDRGLDPDMLDLARAIARLSKAHAEVISLRFIHGLSLQETAVVLGLSIDAIKGRQARALAELRDTLTGAPSRR